MAAKLMRLCEERGVSLQELTLIALFQLLERVPSPYLSIRKAPNVPPPAHRPDLRRAVGAPARLDCTDFLRRYRAQSVVGRARLPRGCPRGPFPPRPIVVCCSNLMQIGVLTLFNIVL